MLLIWCDMAFSIAQQVKNPPAVQETQETWVRSLGQEDPLEEEIGNPLQYSRLENFMDRGDLWVSPRGHKKSATTVTNTFTVTVHVKNKGLDQGPSSEIKRGKTAISEAFQR